MSYSYKPKTPACTVGAKHTWKFVRNGAQAKSTSGMDGHSMIISVRGLYKCACGATRIGQPNRNAPGNDVRDHVQTGATS